MSELLNKQPTTNTEWDIAIACDISLGEAFKGSSFTDITGAKPIVDVDIAAVHTALKHFDTGEEYKNRTVLVRLTDQVSSDITYLHEPANESGRTLRYAMLAFTGGVGASTRMQENGSKHLIVPIRNTDGAVSNEEIHTDLVIGLSDVANIDNNEGHTSSETDKSSARAKAKKTLSKVSSVVAGSTSAALETASLIDDGPTISGSIISLAGGIAVGGFIYVTKLNEVIGIKQDVIRHEKFQQDYDRQKYQAEQARLAAVLLPHAISINWK